MQGGEDLDRLDGEHRPLGLLDRVPAHGNRARHAPHHEHGSLERVVGPVVEPQQRGRRNRAAGHGLERQALAEYRLTAGGLRGQSQHGVELPVARPQTDEPRLLGQADGGPAGHLDFRRLSPAGEPGAELIRHHGGVSHR